MPQYFVEGNIQDQLGAYLKGVTIQLVVNATGQKIGDSFTTTTGAYSAWTDKSPYEISVLFSKTGYQDRKIQISSLMEDPDVTMVPGSSMASIPLAAVALVGGALLLSKKKSSLRGVGKIDSGTVKTGALIIGGVIAFSVIKKLLEKLGVWDSADSKALDAASEDPNSWWSPGYWKTKPSYVSYTNRITSTTASQYAKRIYDATGAFNDDEDAIKSVFTSLPSRAAGSFVADQFQQLYGQDLLKFLRGGSWPQDRLSDSDVNEINRYVFNLPKY